MEYWEIIWPNKSEFYLSKHKPLYNATNKTTSLPSPVCELTGYQPGISESMQAQTCEKISSTPKPQLNFTISLRTVLIFILKQS